MVPSLPERLPEDANVAWQQTLARSGLGGIAATREKVIFGDRDLDDFNDVWRCLDANTGKPLWQVTYLAIGNLDYGNSPRATPLIWRDRVFLVGAMGHVICAALSNGEILWQRSLQDEFGQVAELPWGYCGSPLMAAGHLVLMAGTPDAALVALDPADGHTVWQTPGPAPAYGSLIVANLKGREQIVGQDAESLKGWDVLTGKVLWSVAPENPGDFNVPTPLVWNDQLIVTSEGNGTRVLRFDDDGTPVSDMLAATHRLRPDMSSPVVVGDRLLCVHRMIYSLALSDDLKTEARIRDAAVGEYGAIIASSARALVASQGELLLVDVSGSPRIVSRMRVFDDTVPIYSHPALVGDKLYIRGESSLKCLQLN